MSRLKEKYLKEVVPALQQKFNYKNIMEVPRVEKVVINMGINDARENPKAIESATNDLTAMPVGVKVTLRAQRMYDFLDKLFNINLPRVRDFKGVSPDAFDGRGNYTLGIREQLIFPEIDYDKIDKVRGMDITIVTTAKTDEEARELLKHLGMPFA